jgi:hypothetical protein
MAEIHRIGKWTALSALDEATKACKDNDTLLIVSIDNEEGMMRYWVANATNMQVVWITECIKADTMNGRL